MADVDLKYTTGTGAGTVGAGSMAPYVINRRVTLAEVEATKGSAIAASDAVVLGNLPAGTTILSAAMNIVTADGSTPTAYTLDFGLGTANVDAFVDGADATSAGWATTVLANFPIVTTADDTIEVLVASLTGTPTATTLDCQVVCVPPAAERKGGSARDG